MTVVERARDFLFGEALPTDDPNTALEWVRLAEWTDTQQAAVFVLVGLILVVSAWNVRRVKGLWRRAILMLLRTAVVGVLLYVFYQPAVLEEKRARSTNTVVLLVDDSASMALPHQNGGTRRDMAADFIESHGDFWRAAEDSNVLESYRFSGLLESTDWREMDKELVAGGHHTHTLEIFEELQERYRNRDIGGIVLLSDGIDNGRAGRILSGGSSLDQETVRLLRDFEAPVYTFGVPPDEVRDISVRELRYSPFAFKRNLATIEAEIRVHGYTSGTLEVELLEDGKLVRSVTTSVDPGQTVYNASFEFAPLKLGHQVYNVRVKPFEDEVTLENNERHAVIHVNRDKIRVLQIAGHPSWDVRFLRNHLKRTPNIQLISFFILINPTPGSIRMQLRDTALIPFPAQELFVEELGGFDLVILQDFNYGPFSTPQHMHRIRDYVKEGGALMMVGGRLSMGAGDYAGTELAEILPLEMTIPGALDDALDNDEFSGVLTEVGKTHSVTRLSFDQAANEALWAKLPPLEGLNKTDEVREGATVLASHPTLKTRAGNPMPLLVLGEPDDGRIAVVATDSTWRWKMPAVDAGLDTVNYDTLYNNLIRWLIKDPELDLVRVTPSAGVRSLGDSVDIDVRIVTPDYRPAPAHAFVAKVFRRPGALERGKPSEPGGDAPPAVATKTIFESSDLRTDEHGRWLHTLTPTDPGIYDIEVRTVVAGRQLVGRSVFVVSDERPEMRDVMSSSIMLKAIAAATSGAHHSLSDRDVPMRFNAPRVSDVTSRRYHERWNVPAVFILAVLLMSVEWWVRRRFGFL
ncbi:MAG: putative membrane protein [Myxococcota bacterium]